MSVSSGCAVSTMTRSAESSGRVSRVVFQARGWQVEVYKYPRAMFNCGHKIVKSFTLV